jgi:hypothetical protein
VVKTPDEVVTRLGHLNQGQAHQWRFGKLKPALLIGLEIGVESFLLIEPWEGAPIVLPHHQIDFPVHELEWLL